jgi:2,5-dioxopentanoate dehydrogenase
MLNEGICKSFYQNRTLVLNNKSVTVLSESNTSGSVEKTTGQPTLAHVSAQDFIKESLLSTEVFGPFILAITAKDEAELMQVLNSLEGQLTATLHAEPQEDGWIQKLTNTLSRKVGRILINGYPTGVEVSNAMTHGGPYPATTDPRFTSVGTGAILRFARPITFQNYPDNLLPQALQSSNPLAIWRLLNGAFTQNSI